MSGAEEYGIQSIPPRYDEYNSFYVHTSEGYSRAVEEIDAEEREIAESELRADEQQRLNSEELQRLSEREREEEKRFLESIRLKEEQLQKRRAEISEYEKEEELLTATNVDLLA